MNYYVKKLTSTFLLIVGILFAAVAVWQFYLFVSSPGAEGNTTHLWYASGAAVVLCASALGIFLRNVNKEEEIHITQ